MQQIELLKAAGFHTIEGVDIGRTSHLRMERRSDGENVLLECRRGTRTSQDWQPTWRGPATHANSEWKKRTEDAAAPRPARVAPAGGAQ